MRILCVCENYWPLVGGAEHALQKICEGMAARGHDVSVITHQARATLRYESRAGVEIVRVPCLGNRYIFSLVALPTILRFARCADVIHTATFNAAPPSWLAAKITARPVLVTVWETWIGRWRQYTNFSPVKAALHDVFERMIFALPFDRYIGISNSTAARLREVLPRYKDRVTAIHLGFDPEPWKALRNRKATRESLNAADSFLIVGYGRPGASKGFEHVLEAAPEILERVPNAAILLILSEAAQYKSHLRRLKKRACAGVRFLPAQPFDRLVEIVQAADCVIVPSLAEGFGYAVLEAEAAGTPVVASQTTSIPEVIGGAYRWSIPGDSESIAQAVIAVAHGDVTREPQPAFPWSQTIEAYEREYEAYGGSTRERSGAMPDGARP